MARRVVGFLEYGSALDDFDRLVYLASDEELAALDEIVADHDEFTVYTNLSGQLPTDQEGDSNSYREPTGARRGLAWVIALARVEFGAIVAGFTDHPDPYMYVTPEAYDFKESTELMLDGVLSHLQDLQQDKDYRKITNGGGPIMKTLVYKRRLRIVQKMLEGAMKAGPEWYTPVQAKQLGKYHRDLDDTQDMLIAQIRQYLDAQVSHSDSTTSTPFVWACDMQLRAEKRELESGIATVRKF